MLPLIWTKSRYLTCSQQQLVVPSGHPWQTTHRALGTSYALPSDQPLPTSLSHLAPALKSRAYTDHFRPWWCPKEHVDYSIIAGQAHNSETMWDAFRHHLDKVSSSYWPGLFHCYDIDPLPRTNNDLESHFHDTQRRLLRTTGQKGQTRRALQRIGAWELVPRPPTETRYLAALRQVPTDQLAAEQDRLRQHQERFRLHTRSVRRLNAQFDKLREQWLALAATSAG